MKPSQISQSLSTSITDSCFCLAHIGSDVVGWTSCIHAYTGTDKRIKRGLTAQPTCQLKKLDISVIWKWSHLLILSPLCSLPKMQDSFGCSLVNLFFDTPLVSEGKTLFAGVSWSFLRSFELLFGVSIYDLDAMCLAYGIML